MFKTELPSKKHYCINCRTLHTKLPRHLSRKHLDETDVKNASDFPKGKSLLQSVDFGWGYL